jgi:GNAT superfamily N-acetyltransferase
VDGRLVGSNFAASWGSVAFFGPLSVHPERWNAGVARRLLDATMALFEQWGTEHAALFTFPHSTKHVHLYQAYGFWPRYLTALMSRPVGTVAPDVAWTSYAALAPAEQASALRACRELTDELHPGLDLSREIRAVQEQGLGDTLLLWEGDRLAGFAVCHLGAGSEAGSGTCYVKFGAARSGGAAPRPFERFLQACESLAHARGAQRMVAGVSTARDAAYRLMRADGFRPDIFGLAMHRPNEPGYYRSDVFAIDDLR